MIMGSPITSAAAGTAYLFQPSASDADGDPLLFSASGVPSWASFNADTGALSGTPAEADAGITAEIVVSVSDGEASVSLPAFTIAIASTAPPPVVPAPEPIPSGPPPAGTPAPAPTPANRAPVISGAPASTVQATMAYNFTPAASDPDGQTLAFAISNKPSWAAFSTTTGRLAGTPGATQAGKTFGNIIITVSDGALTARLPAFSIAVTTPANRAPTVSGAPATSASAGKAYSFSPTASDPDGQTLTWSIVNKPSWASFSSTSGRLTGTPAAADAGKTTSSIQISVSDGSLKATLPAFSIAVAAAANRAPTISGTPTTSVVAGASYSFTPASGDADGDTLTFSVSNAPAWLSLSTTTGKLTGTAQAGSWSNIIITVTDGKLSTALPAFSITVTAAPAPATGTATLSWAAPSQNTDGSALTDLAGYWVFHGVSASDLSEKIRVSGASTTTYSFTQLAAGAHYFAVSAYNSAGEESAMSAVGSKTIQ